MVRKLLALVLGLAVAAALLEGAFRVIRPGDYDRSYLVTEDGSRKADLSQVIGFLNAAPGEGAVGRGPHSLMTPGFAVRGCYDRPRWDYFDADGCVEYRLNSHGFRDVEWPVVKPAGQYRVIAIGDSFTFGVGVTLEDTWVKQLERRLAVDRDQDVLVVNAGFVAGNMPPHYAGWLRDESGVLDPDAVIVAVCLNDLGGIPMLAYGFDREPSGSKVLDWIWRRIGERRVQQRLARTEGERDRFDFAKVIARDPKPWYATRDALTRIHTDLAARGVRCLVVVLPMLSQLDADYPYAPLHDMLRGHCEEQGIEVVDLMPVFRGRRDTDLWAHPTDQHPNDVGQALIADAVAGYLRAHPAGDR